MFRSTQPYQKEKQLQYKLHPNKLWSTFSWSLFSLSGMDIVKICIVNTYKKTLVAGANSIAVELHSQVTFHNRYNSQQIFC